MRSPYWVVVLPAIIAGVVYYATEQGALVAVFYFPPALLWWPGIPAVVFAIGWKLALAGLQRRVTHPTGLQYALVAGGAAAATVLIGAAVLTALGGTVSDKIISAFPVGVLPFIVASAGSAWVWSAALSRRSRMLHSQ